MACTLVLIQKQCLMLLLLFVVEIPSSCVAQSNGSVDVGSSLTATDEATPWISPSADFAFGFKKLEDKDLFLVSIWYNKLPERTTVWYANGDNPSPRGSTLVLTRDRGLLLRTPQGQETLISNPIIGVISNGFMNDNGNFVLQNVNSENLWETYKHPTDTILPSQIIESVTMISSRRTDTNFSQGRFLLRIGNNGILELLTINLPGQFKPSYYSIDASGIVNSSLSASTYQLVFNKSAYIYISATSTSQNFLLSRGDEFGDELFYHRATLNYDGVFTHYRRPKNSSVSNDLSWSTVWSIPNDICQATPDFSGGVCGYNKICSLRSNGRPDCQCPQGFTLVDSNDEYRGCAPNFVQSCGEGYADSAKTMYDFVQLNNINWPFSDYDRIEPFDEDSCKESCLLDCMCSVAVFGGSTCWKKKVPLSNGRFSANVNGKSFIKIKKNDYSNSPLLPNTKSNKDTIILFISVFLGSSVFVNFLLVGVISLGILIIHRNKYNQTPKNESFCETNLRYFTYEELVDATAGFSEELGRGSFGIVYKGEIRVGTNTTLIAVKKLDKIAEESNKEFKTEVDVVGQTHHKNLVRLIGFCDDGLQRLLVYEFLKNGSLASFLFGDLKLRWNQRVEIAIGVAKGLLYLHEECNNPIIHCDIKPQNILLDDSYNARISDFGLAKLLRMDQSETQTDIRGTKGYVAPEWFRNMPVSIKTDVYSFGVLLLEIICCRRNVDMDAGEEKAILIYWAYDCYLERRIDILVENDIDAISDWNKLNMFVMVAIWCIQEDPSLRPTMKKVVLMLEGIVEISSPPCPFPFSTIGK